MTVSTTTIWSFDMIRNRMNIPQMIPCDFYQNGLNAVSHARSASVDCLPM